MRVSFFIKAFIFFFFSIIDISFVSARLSSIHERKKIDLVDLPEGCRIKKKWCVIQLKKGRNFKWKLKDFSISFDEGGMVLYKKGDEIQAIKGNFLIETERKLKVLTHFGEFNLDQGLGLLAIHEKQVIATNLTAKSFLVKHRGESQFMVLPKAYQVWIAGFKKQNKKLIPIFGVPRPAHLNQILNLWSRLIEGPDSQFFKHLRVFRNSWKVALEETSLWHKKIVQKKMLSSLSPNQSLLPSPLLSSPKKRNKPPLKKKKNCRLRKLFLEKNYLNLLNTNLPRSCRN